MTKYKVVRLVDLMQLPSDWKWFGEWQKEFREKLEAALNREAREGWMYVDKWGFGEHDSARHAMVVFRKDLAVQNNGGQKDATGDQIQWISDSE